MSAFHSRRQATSGLRLLSFLLSGLSLILITSSCGHEGPSKGGQATVNPRGEDSGGIWLSISHLECARVPRFLGGPVLSPAAAKEPSAPDTARLPPGESDLRCEVRGASSCHKGQIQVVLWGGDLELGHGRVLLEGSGAYRLFSVFPTPSHTGGDEPGAPSEVRVIARLTRCSDPHGINPFHAGVAANVVAERSASVAPR